MNRLFRVMNENNLFTGMMKSGNFRQKIAIKGHSTKTKEEGSKEELLLGKKKKKLFILFFFERGEHD